MATVFNTITKNTMLDSIDAAFNGGTLEIRTGAPPGPGAAPTGTLLVSITLPADLWAAASNAVKPLNAALTPTAAVGAGTAGHFRIKAAGDTGAVSTTQHRIEGTITVTGGGGDITLDNTSIAVGQNVTISTLSLT
ncbi:hypothetical protein J421_3682 [Gemmatirosa kalamazoonensis]|uniref:Uncharacterized protein n=1 Tax=Gemmatirosa kalamazoonensis TaxID=861299 RepID=W0RJH5_9BACT|nr:hypothetical protein [Gemmatirosa kalamazoonensis]AHG91219.1 hypothetical protein J421_3682 [Gemmatirosa kalamazoonensis]